MSHSSFDVHWSFWYMFVSFFVCLDLSSNLCNHMKIPTSMVTPSGPGPGEEFEEHEGFEVLWAQKMLGADGQEQEISMLLLDWLHLDFGECQRTSDITISARVRIIEYLSTAKAVFYIFYFLFKDLGLYCWLRFLFKKPAGSVDGAPTCCIPNPMNDSFIQYQTPRCAHRMDHQQ